jgi:acetyl-CoA carboxylase carboxyl transferase subunit alpha
MAVLDFEKPLVDLEERVEALRILVEAGQASAKELHRREEELDRLRRKLLQRLNRWQRVQLARHMDRPHSVDYIQGMLEEFVEIHGDRLGHDDAAVVGGLGRLQGIPLVVIGHEKGRTLQQRGQRHFGMPHPEGNRKALRLMALAERFKRPILTLVDTPGAYPGVEAEARGQASAIAENLLRWAMLKSPSLSVVIGEGGSGGALALAMADRVLMMEHAMYSVISPEGCAAILWRDEGKKAQAAEALRLTAQDALAMGLIQDIVPEPPGGAHRNQQAAMGALREACHRHLRELLRLPLEELLAQRYRRYRGMGVTEGEEGGSSS